MISIIICSRTQAINKNLSENIKNTVGCDYELVVIDNSEHTYSIFEAYNLGITKSVGDYLCFIHDDVLFHTHGWGTILQIIFENNKKIGLLGIAGAKFKTKMPSTWWDSPEKSKVMNIIQHFRGGKTENLNYGFDSNSLQEVVTLDGVFMALRKDTIIFFNKHLTGFHNYDLNICFECIQKGYKIVVTNEILIEHFSAGTINESWVDSTFAIHKVYKNLLPLSILENREAKIFEVENAKRFIRLCLKYNRKQKAFFIWIKFFITHPVSKFHLTFIKKMYKNE